MSAPKIFYARLTDYTLSATGTDAGYPLANLQTGYASDLWKGATTGANQSLVIDFGAARSCNSLVLGGHNFNGIADTGVRLQGADDSGFSTNLVTAVSRVDVNYDPIAFSFAAVSRRYWRLYFEAYNPLARIPALGNIILGTSLDFLYSYEFPFKRNQGQFQTARVTTLSGKIRGAQAFAGRGVFEFQFRIVTDAFALLFQTFVNTVRGGLYPFYFLDADGSSLYYVVLSEDYNPVDTIHADQNDIQSMKLVAQLATLQ